MITEDTRSQLRAPKFTPLTDGSSFRVPHPDYAWLMPTQTVLHINADDQGSQRIAVPQIARIATVGEETFAE